MLNEEEILAYNKLSIVEIYLKTILHVDDSLCFKIGNKLRISPIRVHPSVHYRVIDHFSLKWNVLFEDEIICSIRVANNKYHIEFPNDPVCFCVDDYSSINIDNMVRTNEIEFLKALIIYQSLKLLYIMIGIKYGYFDDETNGDEDALYELSGDGYNTIDIVEKYSDLKMRSSTNERIIKYLSFILYIDYHFVGYHNYVDGKIIEKNNKKKKII